MPALTTTEPVSTSTTLATSPPKLLQHTHHLQNAILHRADSDPSYLISSSATKPGRVQHSASRSVTLADVQSIGGSESAQTSKSDVPESKAPTIETDGVSNKADAMEGKGKMEECVDYLSYNFDAFDLHQCWRIATRKKDSVSNGRRLENASWRKFFQMKFKLKTIDPASLNWEKDSDVVWLYGPFHTYDPLPVLEAQFAAAAKAHAKAIGVKPALKRRDEKEKFIKTLRDLERKSSDPVEPTAEKTELGPAFISSLPTPPTGRKVAFFLEVGEELPTVLPKKGTYFAVPEPAVPFTPDLPTPPDTDTESIENQHEVGISEEDWDNAASLSLKRSTSVNTGLSRLRGRTKDYFSMKSHGVGGSPVLEGVEEWPSQVQGVQPQLWDTALREVLSTNISGIQGGERVDAGLQSNNGESTHAKFSMDDSSEEEEEDADLNEPDAEEDTKMGFDLGYQPPISPLPKDEHVMRDTLPSLPNSSTPPSKSPVHETVHEPSLSSEAVAYVSGSGRRRTLTIDRSIQGTMPILFPPECVQNEMEQPKNFTRLTNDAGFLSGEMFGRNGDDENCEVHEVLSRQPSFHEEVSGRAWELFARIGRTVMGRG